MANEQGLCLRCGVAIEPWVDGDRTGWSHLGPESFQLNGRHKSEPYVAPADCTCPREFKSPGRLYGIAMMERWLRMSVAADCPEHSPSTDEPEPQTSTVPAPPEPNLES